MNASVFRQNLIGNFFAQFFGQGGARVLALLFNVLLAREIGRNGFGIFSFTLTICLLIAQPIMDLGVDLVVTKWVAMEKNEAFNIGKRIKLISIPFGAIITLLFSFFLSVDRSILAIFIVYQGFVSLSSLYFSYFRGIQLMKYEGMLIFLQRIFMILLLIIFAHLLNYRNALIGATSMLVPSIITFLILFKLAEDFPIKSNNHIEAKRFLSESIPLAMVSILWLIYYKIDSFMLGIIKSMEEVGIYNAAYKLMEGSFFLPSIIMMVVFPKLSQFFSKDKILFRKVYLRIMLFLFLLGLLGSVVLFSLSNLFIKILYTEEFAQSVKVLKILSLVLIPVFIGHLTSQTLVILGRERLYTLFVAVGAILNVVLNLMLIPTLGARGAAIATIITEFFVSITCGFGGLIWMKKA